MFKEVFNLFISSLGTFKPQIVLSLELEFIADPKNSLPWTLDSHMTELVFH